MTPQLHGRAKQCLLLAMPNMAMPTMNPNPNASPSPSPNPGARLHQGHGIRDGRVCPANPPSVTLTLTLTLNLALPLTLALTLTLV